MISERYIIHPRDCDQNYAVTRMATNMVREAAKAAQTDDQLYEVMIRPYKPPRSDRQRRTLFMWHGEVASELTLRTPSRWRKDDVHELIFLPRFMPTVELVLPTGEVVTRQMRTSDKAPEEDDRSTRKIVSDAMESYLAWIYEMGIEVTIPDNDWKVGI